MHGTTPAETEGFTVVTAEVPQHELARYPIDLRSVSHGTGSFTRSFVRYDYMPTALARTVMADDELSKHGGQHIRWVGSGPAGSGAPADHGPLASRGRHAPRHRRGHALLSMYATIRADLPVQVASHWGGDGIDSTQSPRAFITTTVALCLWG